MTRLLAALALAAAPLALAPAPASACTGPVCDAACDAWTSKPVQLVVGSPCPLN